MRLSASVSSETADVLLQAPCAQTALNYDVMYMTEESCPEAVTSMQSCVCSKSNFYSSIGLQLSSDVSQSCGNTATDDQASVSTVFSLYCNQDAVVAFPTPSISVSQYITDIPEISYMPPCASSGISYIAMTMVRVSGPVDSLDSLDRWDASLTDLLLVQTYKYCPADTPDLATCMCQKQQNSLMISQLINTGVGEACSSLTVDISSAQAFFSAYCNLLSGTSSFPTASNPPGDSMFSRVVSARACSVLH